MDNISKEIKAEIKEKFEDSTMTKTGRLAMELAAERSRLRQEMEELQVQVEDLSPATPTGTIDSYVKWAATATSSCGCIFTECRLYDSRQSSLCPKQYCMDLCRTLLE